MLKTTLDIQISFFCRSTHTYENGENPIVMRIGYRGQRRDIFTGLACPPQFWLTEMYLVSPKYKPGATINKNLMAMQTNALQAFNLLKMKDEEFTLDELVDAIKGKTPPPQTIMEYVLIKEKVHNPVKLTYLNRSKLTYLFAGEDLNFQWSNN